MISRVFFVEQVKRLEAIYEKKLTEDQFKHYYAALAPDFTDDNFDAAVNFALKNSFKFPPIAAFYKKDPLGDALAAIYSPVTDAESAQLRKVLAKYDDK